jgi:hypothetical protein
MRRFATDTAKLRQCNPLISKFFNKWTRDRCEFLVGIGRCGPEASWKRLRNVVTEVMTDVRVEEIAEEVVASEEDTN